MSRGLLAFALLISAAWAKEQPAPKTDKRKPRAALSAAACAGDSPALLVRQKDPPEGAVGGAVELARDKSCGDALADLPDEAEIALRPPRDPANPSGELTEADVKTAFEKPKKLSELSSHLERQAQALGISGLDAKGLDAFFDKSASAKAAPERRRKLTIAMTDALKGDVSLAAPTASPAKAASPVKQKGLKTNSVPVPSWWHDNPPIVPPDQPVTSQMSRPNYSDGRGWLSRQSPIAPPPGISLPQNLQGTPSSKFQAPNKSDKSAPVWTPFYAAFTKCREELKLDPSCEPYNFGIWRAGSMCHSSGSAIDVGGVKCSGVIHTALQNGLFKKLVEQCMIAKMPKTIWQRCFINCRPFNYTTHHYDHAHFSVGCGWGRW